MNEIISKMLIEKATEMMDTQLKDEPFANNEEADKLIKNTKEYPHAFILACIMDGQIPAERAWLIPYEIQKEIGSFKFQRLFRLSQEQYKNIFIKKKLHRFNSIMADYFYSGIQKIHLVYPDDASEIWNDKPKSAIIIKRFLQFKGIVIKIASMAANILSREFHVPMADKSCLDISPDVHIKRVFKRLSFSSANATEDEVIYCTREIHGEYPGLLDLICWKSGREWCHAHNPDCEKCFLNIHCPKIN